VNAHKNCSKFFEKTVDALSPVCHYSFTHGNKKQKHMRTKSLLAAAALIAAGVAASQAQSNVYSLNVVGYVNLTIQPGYNLITSQLKSSTGSSSVNVLLTNAPALADGSTFFSWNSGAQDFNQADIWVQAENTWYLGDGSAPTTSASPRGESYFINNLGSSATLTLVGEVHQGSTVAAVPANYGFLGDGAPVSQEIKTNGFPIADSSTLQTFDTGIQDYSQAIIGDSGSWLLGDGSAEAIFAPAVGQGFLYFNPGAATTWTRNFTVQ
jgi:hypothetical protein